MVQLYYYYYINLLKATNDIGTLLLLQEIQLAMRTTFNFRDISVNGHRLEPVFFFEQQRCRTDQPACSFAQTDQHLLYSLFGKYNIKAATSELSIV